MIAALFDLLPLWVTLPLLLVLCALGLIVAAALFQASVMLADAAWHGSLHMTNALTLAFARAGMFAFQWCGSVVQGVLQILWALIRTAWALTAGRLQAVIVARWRVIRQRAHLRNTWRNEFRDEFATFDEFLYAFEHGGKRRQQHEEPAFDASQPDSEPQGRDEKHPPPDPQKAAYAAACRLLGLPESGFTREQLNARYRTLISTTHPDRAGSHHRAAAINAARAVLINRTKG